MKILLSSILFCLIIVVASFTCKSDSTKQNIEKKALRYLIDTIVPIEPFFKETNIVVDTILKDSLTILYSPCEKIDPIGKHQLILKYEKIGNIYCDTFPKHINISDLSIPNLGKRQVGFEINKKCYVKNQEAYIVTIKCEKKDSKNKKSTLTYYFFCDEKSIKDWCYIPLIDYKYNNRE